MINTNFDYPNAYEARSTYGMHKAVKPYCVVFWKTKPDEVRRCAAVRQYAKLETAKTVAAAMNREKSK